MVTLRIFVTDKEGNRRELTARPVPMVELNAHGVIILTPMPEPIEVSRSLAITFLVNTKKPQFMVHPGETLSFEVQE
jgi:hypothetical protein